MHFFIAHDGSVSGFALDRYLPFGMTGVKLNRWKKHPATLVLTWTAFRQTPKCLGVCWSIIDPIYACWPGLGFTKTYEVNSTPPTLFKKSAWKRCVKFSFFEVHPRRNSPDGFEESWPTESRKMLDDFLGRNSAIFSWKKVFSSNWTKHPEI
jgi:hypothetical protein